MATYSANGTGSQFSSYMHARVEVTRTDYDTYSSLYVVCKVVSDGGSSSFISGRCTASTSGYGAYSSEQSVSAYGSTTLKTATFTVTRGTSSKTQVCKAAILGGGTGMYAGKYDEASVSVSIPAISYDAPNAPTGASATYVSDSQATVSWTNGSTTATKPRTATVVERQADGGAWAQVASVASNATSYADNGIEANHQYVYRVAAQNSVGLSSYATSSAIYTTPAAPTSITLEKTGATAVTVDVTGSMPYATGFDVQSTYDNGATWTTEATGTSMPYAATVGAGTVMFRVRATRSALESAWTQSASLVTVCPPLAPTITASPANPTAYGDSDTISWTPNHPDGSAQSAAQIKVTDPGGTSTTYSVTTATSYTLTPNATGTWTAQVRTKGLDASYGEWSQTISWGVHNPPAVVITTPASDGTTVTALPLSVAWTVTDGTGVSAQRIIVADLGGNQLLNRTLPAADRSASFGASDLSLADGESYGITLRVMGGSGLVTEQTRIFDVAWLAPAAPVLQLTEGEGRSATIDVMDTHYSESGATIAVDGSAIADEFTVYGNSTQDGTPTPSTPVPILSIEPQNLTPFFSVAKTDTSYWAAIGGSYTELDDGWVRFSRDNSAGTSAVTERFRVKIGQLPDMSASTGYTLLVEFRNVSFSPSTGNAVVVRACGSSATVMDTNVDFNSNLGTVREGAFYSTVTTKSSLSQTYFWDGYFYLYAGASATIDMRVSLYAGSHTGAYVPYGMFGVSIKDPATTYSIDLQGNSLRSLPDGTRDELRVEGGSAKIVQRVWHIADISARTLSYSSGSIPYVYFPLTAGEKGAPTSGSPARNNCMSTVAPPKVPLADPCCYVTNDGLTVVIGSTAFTSLATATTVLTGAEFDYALATPQEIDLGAVSDLPFIPEDGEMWVDGTTMEAVLRPADYAGQPAIQSVDVQRVNADGTAWTVATGLTVGGSCIDPLPPLGIPVEYRAIASASSGATATAVYSETFGGKDWVLNFGAGAQEFVDLTYNPQASYSLVQGGASYHFADGGAGRGRPVFYATTDRDESGTLKFATIGQGKTDRLRELLDRYPVCWLRDPFGHRWRAVVKPSSTHGVGSIFEASLSWDAVRWEEAW